MEAVISQMIPKSTVFMARDGMDALNKLQNFPPHVLITDLDVPKLSGTKLVEHARTMKVTAHTAVIIAGTLPPAENSNLDEVISGKLHFFTSDGNEAQLRECITKALSFSLQPTSDEFRLRVIKEGDILLKEGDKADFVYLVKKGRLKALRIAEGKEVMLGFIEYGEFAGEMAFINGELRNATVIAVTDCELIQVPIHRFDKVLYSQPNWTKALMLTLTKRVTALNAAKKSATD